MLSVLHGAFGFLALIGIAWLISENRRAVPWRIVICGVLLQVALAALLFRLPLILVVSALTALLLNIVALLIVLVALVTLATGAIAGIFLGAG